MESQTIIHTIASGKKTLSLEFFPPKSDKAIQQLKESSRDLAKLSPDFVSITYEAVVVVVVIKELSGDEVSTCVYFFLKVLDIVCLRWGFGVFFQDSHRLRSQSWEIVT